MGSACCTFRRDLASCAAIDAVDYQPVLAQRHIAGPSIGVTVLCERGRVVAQVGQERDPARFGILTNADLLANVTRLVALTGYRLPATSTPCWVTRTASPISSSAISRFWYSIYLVMIAGLNFVELALAEPVPTSPVASTLDRGEIFLSLRNTLTRPWRAARLDWKFLFYNLSDPLAYLLQRANTYDDSGVAVPVAQMNRSDPVDAPTAPRRRRRGGRVRPFLYRRAAPGAEDAGLADAKISAAARFDERFPVGA